MKYYIDYDLFTSHADKFIEDLITSIEENDEQGIISIDLFDDKVVLNVEGQNNPYIISKHGTYREMWFVSPLSGPDRFKLVEEKWVNGSGAFLEQIIVKELSNFCAGMKINA